MVSKKLHTNIKKTDDIPSLFNILRSYFPNIRPHQDGGIYYTKVKLRLTNKFHNLNININLWIKGEANRLYTCPLQVENTIEIGWLENSISIMSTPFLTSAIQDTIGGKIQISLRC